MPAPRVGLYWFDWRWKGASLFQLECCGEYHREPLWKMPCWHGIIFTNYFFDSNCGKNKTYPHTVKTTVNFMIIKISNLCISKWITPILLVTSLAFCHNKRALFYLCRSAAVRVLRGQRQVRVFWAAAIVRNRWWRHEECCKLHKIAGQGRRK